MKSQETFGAILKRLREAKGLSQHELAEKSNISRVQITRLENGTREPMWQTVQHLCAALEVRSEVFEQAALKAPKKPAKPSKPAAIAKGKKTK